MGHHLFKLSITGSFLAGNITTVHYNIICRTLIIDDDTTETVTNNDEQQLFGSTTMHLWLGCLELICHNIRYVSKQQRSWLSSADFCYSVCFAEQV